jgi:hypothetical protein
MAVLGLTRRTSYADVTAGAVVVRMGIAFRLAIDRAAISVVRPDTDRVTGWGVHGWRGVWLVNGSSGGLVRVEVDPPAPGRVLGFPIRVRVLRIALEEPVAFMAAVS